MATYSVYSDIAQATTLMLSDGNTVAWYDYNFGITKNVSNQVSQWDDKLGSGNNLLQADDTSKPIWSSDGLLFDGSNDFLKSLFAYIQPHKIYLVIRQITWAADKYILIGPGGGFPMILAQTTGGTSPQLSIYSGAVLGADTNLSLNTWGIVRALFNGASSTLQINGNAATSGNAGTTYTNAGGVMFGGNSATKNANFQIKEAIFRKVGDSVGNETIIYNYLKAKYSL